MARTVGSNIQAKKTTNASELVKKAMKVRGYTQAMMAKELGYSRANAIGNALGGRNMQINVLAMMLDELGFDIIIRDRNNSNRENQWKVELQDTTPPTSE